VTRELIQSINKIAHAGLLQECTVDAIEGWMKDNNFRIVRDEEVTDEEIKQTTLALQEIWMDSKLTLNKRWDELSRFIFINFSRKETVCQSNQK
jgi:hypothetical protein